jgi:hypothetical protein
MVTTVSRRLVYVKKTKNPRTPLPRRPPSSKVTASEAAKPSKPFAAPVPCSVPKTGWKAYGKPAAILAGVLCIGVAIVAMGKVGATRSYSYEAEVRPVVSRSSSVRVQTPISERELQGEALPSVLAQREAPTDEGFRASAYARRR